MSPEAARYLPTTSPVTLAETDGSLESPVPVTKSSQSPGRVAAVDDLIGHESLLEVAPDIRESHAVILRDRVVPASQVPFPGEPIPRRAFRRAWEWDLTSRDNSVPKKLQRGILFLTRNYQTIAKNRTFLHSFYSNLSSVMIVGAGEQRTIDQSQT